MRLLVILCLFFSLGAFSQKNQFFQIDSLPKEGILLDKGWKWHAGDNPDFAKADFDDSKWKRIDPTKDIAALPEIFNAEIKWLRLDFEVKNKLLNPLGIAINQAGASEIYLNGRLIHQFGHFDTDSTKVKACDPLEIPIYFPADSVGQYYLAVRYALQPNIRYTNIYATTQNRLFNATLVNLIPTLNAQKEFRVYYTGLDIFKFAIYFMIFILHLAFYLYQRSNKTHLVLAICFLVFTLTFIFKIIGQNQFSIEYRYLTLNISNWFYGLGSICLYNAFYRIVKERLNIYYYAMVVVILVYMLVPSFTYGFPWQSILFLVTNTFGFILMGRLTRIGFKKGIKGFLILGVTFILSILGVLCIGLAVVFLNYGFSPSGYKTLNYGFSPYLIEIIFMLGATSLPIGLSLFMGIEGNETNKALKKQLVENDQLKNEAIKQEQEKQQILATQNGTLEKQIEARTAELKTSQAQLIQSEKLASLGELTAGIAHEIQNPLNFVNNFSEVSVELANELQEALRQRGIEANSEEGELVSDLIQNQEKIHHHGKRASSIVKGMLEHSRASTGVKELTDINALADEYLRLSYHGLRAKDSSFNADFKTNFDENLPKIEVIPQDFGRVLLNLINNAFYATKGVKNPLVEIKTERLENGVTISVKDNGSGMSETTKAKIFQPFFTTKPTGEGTGLGLSLAYDIVTKGHGGTLEVESEEGFGTTFIIKLPIS